VISLTLAKPNAKSLRDILCTEGVAAKCWSSEVDRPLIKYNNNNNLLVSLKINVVNYF